ncbi:MAG: hypothetical protein WBR26_09315 [Candidatus Acidiferrum sp.]
METTQRVRPSAAYYLLALLSFVAGLALTVFFFVTDTRRVCDSMARMDVPGEIDLDLQHNETYTVFVEHPNSPVPPSAPEWHWVDCEVHMPPSGQLLDAKPALASSTYRYGARRGTSILQFQVPHDGVYTVDCRTEKLVGEKVQVAIGGGAAKALSGIIAKCFVVLMGGLVIGVLIFVRVAMLRLESRRDIREQGLKPV